MISRQSSVATVPVDSRKRPAGEMPVDDALPAPAPAPLPPAAELHTRLGFAVLCGLLCRHYSNAQAPGFAADVVRFRGWAEMLMQPTAPTPASFAECEFAMAATELIFEVRRAIAAGEARSARDPVRMAVGAFRRDFEAFRALFATAHPALHAAMIPYNL